MKESLEKRLLEYTVYQFLKPFCASIIPIKENPYYSFLVSSSDITQRFAVDVMDYDSEREFLQRVRLIEENVSQDSRLKIPIVCFYVNRNSGKKFLQVILNWRYNTPEINAYDPRKAKEATFKNIQDLLMIIDNTVRVLPEKMWCFVNRIIINEPNFPSFELIYLRSYIDAYLRNKQISKERLLADFYANEIFLTEENAYKDELDECVWQSVKGKYGNAEFFQNIMFTNNSLKSWQRYKDYQSAQFVINLMPQNQNVYMQQEEYAQIPKKNFYVEAFCPTTRIMEVNFVYENNLQTLLTINQLLTSSYQHFTKILM